MLAESLEFPRAGDDWLQTILIGGVLSLLTVLIVPGILINGYLLRVVRAAVEETAVPPKFDEWVDLFVDGILVWVIQFIYVGVPTVILGVVIGSFVLIASVTTGGAPPTRSLALGGVVAVAVFLPLLALLVVAGYLLPAAIANFARVGEIGAAFHLRTIIRAAFSWDYFVAIVLVIAVSIVLGFIGGLLTVILVGFFVLFYLQMVIYHLIGRGFTRGLAGRQSSAG